MFARRTHPAGAHPVHWRRQVFRPAHREFPHVQRHRGVDSLHDLVQIIVQYHDLNGKNHQGDFGYFLIQLIVQYYQHNGQLHSVSDKLHAMAFLYHHEINGKPHKRDIANPQAEVQRPEETNGHAAERPQNIPESSDRRQETYQQPGHAEKTQTTKKKVTGAEKTNKNFLVNHFEAPPVYLETNFQMKHQQQVAQVAEARQAPAQLPAAGLQALRPEGRSRWGSGGAQQPHPAPARCSNQPDTVRKVGPLERDAQRILELLQRGRWGRRAAAAAAACGCPPSAAADVARLQRCRLGRQPGDFYRR